MTSLKRILSTVGVLALLFALLSLCACDLSALMPPPTTNPPSGGTVTPPADKPTDPTPSDPTDPTPSDPTDPTPDTPTEPDEPSEPEVCVHTGGTATCKTKAVCQKCGESYGALDPDAHESDAVTYAVNSDDLEMHDLIYACCGATKATEAHTGGTATCKARAVCDECDTAYGELDPDVHESDAYNYLQNEEDPSQHDLRYACCEALIRTEPHSGTEATCKTPAYCDKCRDSYGAVGDHELIVVSSTAQSCTEDAVAVYECRHCDYTRTECGAQKTGHTISLWNVVSERRVEGTSCEYDVTLCGTCSVCLQSDVEKTERRTVHEYVASIAKDATCSLAGEKTYVCRHGCVGAIFTAPYENADAHVWANDGALTDGVQAMRCTKCSAEKSVILTDAPTHTTTKDSLGGKELCLGEISLALDASALAALADGELTLGASPLAGDALTAIKATLSTEQLALLGEREIYAFTLSQGEAIHELSGYVTVTLPYELKAGEDPECIVVWYIDENGVAECIEATYEGGFVTFRTDHFSAYVPTGTTREEACEINGHNLVAGKTTPSTCTTDGYTEYICSRCGEISLSDIVPASGHKYSDSPEIVPPSCTSEGKYTYTCTADGCGYVLTLTLPKSHTLEYDYAGYKAPTCQEDGYSLLRCTKDGCTYTEKEILPADPINNHDWKTDYEFVREGATLCTDGVRRYYLCSHCGEKREDEIYYEHIEAYKDDGEMPYNEEYLYIDEHLTIGNYGERPAIIFRTKGCLCQKSYTDVYINDPSTVFGDGYFGSLSIYDHREEEFRLATMPIMYSDPVRAVILKTVNEADENTPCLTHYILSIEFDDGDAQTENEILYYTLDSYYTCSTHYRTELTLDIEGGRCSDGYTEKAICENCERVIWTHHTNTKDGEHYYVTRNYIATLQKTVGRETHKMNVVYQGCACGQTRYTVLNRGDCRFSQQSRREGDYIVTTYQCSCGMYYELWKKETQSEFGCFKTTYTKVIWDSDLDGVLDADTGDMFAWETDESHVPQGTTAHFPTDDPCVFDFTITYHCDYCKMNVTEKLPWYYTKEGTTTHHDLTTVTGTDSMGYVTETKTCSHCDYVWRTVTAPDGNIIYRYSITPDKENDTNVEEIVSYKTVNYEHLQTGHKTSVIDAETGEVRSWEQTLTMYLIGTAEGCIQYTITLQSDGTSKIDRFLFCTRDWVDSKDSTCTQMGYYRTSCRLCGTIHTEYQGDRPMGHEYAPNEYGECDPMTGMQEILSYVCMRCGAVHYCDTGMEYHFSDTCELVIAENATYDPENEALAQLGYVFRYHLYAPNTQREISFEIRGVYEENGERFSIATELSLTETDGGDLFVSKEALELFAATCEKTIISFRFVVYVDGTITSYISF